MYDLIVIGGGPAGLTATIYAIRKRLKVLLVSKDLGGKTNFNLELPDLDTHWVIRGVEIVDKFRNELEYLDFARHMDAVERVEREDDLFVVHTREGAELRARSLILATGARQKWLDVPGERQFLSKGLCYSALSYAPLFIDKRTAVIGNGDLALRSAAELSLVAEEVHVIGPAGAILDTPLGQKVRASSNVTILENYRVTEVLGNGFCNALRVQSPAGEVSEITTDGAFVEQALTDNTEMVADLVELDENRCVIVDCYCHTNVPGLFAAGDVTSIYGEQVLVAVGEGVKAALSAFDYLLR